MPIEDKTMEEVTEAREGFAEPIAYEIGNQVRFDRENKAHPFFGIHTIVEDVGGLFRTNKSGDQLIHPHWFIPFRKAELVQISRSALPVAPVSTGAVLRDQPTKIAGYVYKGKKVVSIGQRTVNGKVYDHVRVESGESFDITPEEYEAIIIAAK